MMQEMQGAAPMQGQEAKGGESKATALIAGIDESLNKLGALLEKSGVGGPEALQKLQGIIEGYQSLMGEVIGAGQGSAKAEPTASATVEAGANPNARPM
jgi:hypothetical protein